ncbi:helix-turn-helix transcriptional regulator [Phytohabitans flavus]|uniref:Transcriptional regulator n=1 Tax=Phytohabitans flavus TaxID=1076124 RepID=A0A6F8Y5L4_9ACTN|nr:helix-turn-helix transcriptional regulator [Phytohabitans flavus]BCB81319.1 transcriptional regulator [Phytohabitans flavus]
MPTKRENFAQSLRAQWLGVRMREHRERHKLTLQDVAPIVEHEFSTIARYERALWPFPLPVLTMLLDVYGIVDERERDLLTEAARHSWRINRWDADTGPSEVDVPFIDYSWVQARAREIWVYGATYVPALLQTRPYLETLTRAKEGDALPGFKFVNLVRARMDLQKVLTTRPPVQVHALIEEAALRRPVGGVDMLRDQLEHLVKLGQRANVQVQILPPTVGEHPALDGPFTVLHMRGEYPPVVYLEHLGGRMLLEKERAARYVSAYERLQEIAGSPSASTSRIEALAADIDDAVQVS